MSNDNERLRAEELVTAVLRASGAGRILASSVQSLEAEIGRRLQGLVDRLDVRVDLSTVMVFGVLDRYQQLAQVRNRIIEELDALGVERAIDTAAIVALEQKVVDALGPAGVAGSVHVTETDLVVRVMDGPADAARLVAETVIRALGWAGSSGSRNGPSSPLLRRLSPTQGLRNRPPPPDLVWLIWPFRRSPCLGDRPTSTPIQPRPVHSSAWVTQPRRSRSRHCACRTS